MIFYFSGTGNSRYVAQALAEALDEQLLAIAECLNTGNLEFSLDAAEKVGIVTPVYFYGLPSIVEEFLDKVQFNCSPSMYLVVTFGSFTANTGPHAQKMLSEQGRQLDYLFSVQMPENYVPLFKVPASETRTQLFVEAEKTIAQIVQSLRENKIGDHDASKGKFPRLVSAVCRQLYRGGMTTKKFWTTEACTACGLCARLCPVAAISLADGKPSWTKEKCPRCLACLHRCPVEAIQLGHLTKNKERYVHPQLSE